MTEYVTRPQYFRVECWTDKSLPPENVHDTFTNHSSDSMISGYVRTPDGEKLINFGECVVTDLATGKRSVMTTDEVNKRFERRAK